MFVNYFDNLFDYWKGQNDKRNAKEVGTIGSEADICIIVPSQSSQNYSSLMTPYPLPHGIRWAVEEFGAANSICIETMMRFKGLESNYLYFWGADQFDRNVDVELLYVTLSRAKSRLCLVGDQKACAALVGAGRASDSV